MGVQEPLEEHILDILALLEHELLVIEQIDLVGLNFPHHFGLKGLARVFVLDHFLGLFLKDWIKLAHIVHLLAEQVAEGFLLEALGDALPILEFALQMGEGVDVEVIHQVDFEVFGAVADLLHKQLGD